MSGECETLFPVHGGQVRRIMEQFPGAPQPYIDLSTGISPFAYPFSPDMEKLRALPQPHEEYALMQAAAHAYGVADSQYVVAGPGTQLLINLLPMVFSAQNVTIWGPTYSGHERAWRRAGRVVQHVETMAACDAAIRRGDAVVVVNPNNPDGRLVSKACLAQWADLCAAAGGLLIIDEAFADFGDESVTSLLPHAGLVVLRSFGKTYGLPGIRLGFALGSREEISRLRGLLGEWSVSVEALAVGCAALKDAHWYQQARPRAWDDTRRLAVLLEQYGLEVIGQAPLFRLVRHEQAQHLWRVLCEDGIITRRFEGRDTVLRFGLPAEASAWQRLEKALQKWAARV
ncbi:threonine-phosphate decarboxylase CobD [Neokomagataea thailandica]|uniref:threonine-phosphate decarboxylase n=1 Tax=Neokomagataea tanensis NBRC 106556 TaxID=1223519 RepID=A0ABQ0QI55_9PROT|nr:MULTISPECIES: threonine-phosphate decarboxylase CobD [Neokomagataea]GBR45586.1 L-threonine-O-3-phosphate decarboxylase [Neokomagataea tanensis NBRC 106556]